MWALSTLRPQCAARSARNGLRRSAALAKIKTSAASFRASLVAFLAGCLVGHGVCVLDLIEILVQLVEIPVPKTDVSIVWWPLAGNALPRLHVRRRSPPPPPPTEQDGPHLTWALGTTITKN